MISILSEFYPLIMGPIYILAFFGIFALIFIFWIWMLVDLLKRKNFDDKLIWAVVIVFLHIIGAILYYFLVYSKSKTRKTTIKRKR